MLAAALPHSLCKLELSEFVPYSGAAAEAEPEVLRGLKSLLQSVKSIPNLEMATIEQEDLSWWSDKGRDMFYSFLGGVVDSDDVEAFIDDYWIELGSAGGGSDDEVDSEDVSVEVMAAASVSEASGAVFSDDAVWEGDEDGTG